MVCLVADGILFFCWPRMIQFFRLGGSIMAWFLDRAKKIKVIG